MKADFRNVTAGMPESCAYCGKTHEVRGQTTELIDLRPYGRNGAWICFDCGMKPEYKDTTEQTFTGILNESEIVLVGEREEKTKLN